MKNKLSINGYDFTKTQVRAMNIEYQYSHLINLKYP